MVAVQSWFRLIVKKVGVFLGFPGKKKFQKRSPTDKIYSNGQRIRAKERISPMLEFRFYVRWLLQALPVGSCLQVRYLASLV